MDIIAQLDSEHYQKTAEDLIRYLELIRTEVDPRAKPFTKCAAGNLQYHRPVDAFYLMIVLQRWATDPEGRKLSKDLPWHVLLVREHNILTGTPEPILCVCKRILGNTLKREWSITGDELVHERQVLPEEQQALRLAFGLRPRDGCPDKVFFQDVYGILETF